MSSTNSTSAAYIKSILINAANIAKYIDQIIIEEKVGGSAKKFLQDTRRKAEGIDRDIMLRVSPEFAAIIRSEISENWDTIAHENIRIMAASLNDEQLRNLEQYTEELMNGTYRPANFTDLNDLTKLLNESIGEHNIEVKLQKLKDAGFDIIRKN